MQVMLCAKLHFMCHLSEVIRKNPVFYPLLMDENCKICILVMDKMRNINEKEVLYFKNCFYQSRFPNQSWFN